MFKKLLTFFRHVDKILSLPSDHQKIFLQIKTLTRGFKKHGE